MINKRRTNPQPVTIKIFQANVDKGQEPHSAALQLAFLEGYNVVILQEPSTPYNKQKSFAAPSIIQAFFVLVRSTLGITTTHAPA